MPIRNWSVQTRLCSSTLAPHVEQAINLGHILEIQTATRSALIEMLSQKADGIILISRTGVPSFMNETACKILQNGDGFSSDFAIELVRFASLEGAATA